MNCHSFRKRSAVAIAGLMLGFVPAALAQLAIPGGKPAPGYNGNPQTEPFQVIRIEENAAVRAVKTPGVILKSAAARPMSQPWEAWATGNVHLPLYDDIALQPAPTVALNVSIGCDGKPEEIRVLDPRHTDVRLARLAKELVRSWEFEYVRRWLTISAPPQLAEQIRRVHERLQANSTITIVLHFNLEPLPVSARKT